MKYSIRTRLALLITLVYASVFFFLLAAGAAALYIGLQDQMDKQLQDARNRIIALYEFEYSTLPSKTGDERNELAKELLDDLKDIHGRRNQFVALSIDTESGQMKISQGDIDNIELLLPEDFYRKEAGLKNQRLQGELFRVLITKRSWGTVVVGLEYQALFEVAEEFKDILIVGLPLTLVLVLVGGYFLAGRAMQPAVATAEAAENITLTNLSERLPEYNGRDEFGKLVTTLNYMIERLEDGVKQVQQFTQDAAHELRTPLTILRGELELAYQQPDIQEETRAVLQKSLDHAISMSKIVENLMFLARSDTGDYPIQKSTFQLDVLVNDLIDDLKSFVDGRPVEIRLVHCDKITFSGDKQLFQRLVLNLSDNALKNTEQGYIEVKLQKLDNSLELTIRDTGKGIPEDDLPYVFDRFYRVDKARTRTTGGSGLGLAICKWIVDLHGGKISMESKPSEGTTVKITLPVHP
jgi:heavy metal sensor kinase